VFFNDTELVTIDGVKEEAMFLIRQVVDEVRMRPVDGFPGLD